MELNGGTALVTGGAVRIGRAICTALAAAGCRVVVHCRQSVDEANDLVADLSRSAGVDGAVVRGDLADPQACERVFADAWDWAGGIDFLVNNASIFRKQPFLEATTEDFAEQWRVNLLAPTLLLQRLAARASTGAVVNLLDRRIVGNDADCVPYLLAKKGLAELTRMAALELAPNIRVNAVAPGPVLPPPGMDDAYLAEHAGAIPLERAPSPEAVADAVLFLLRSDSITGQTLFVDGGQRLV